MCEKKKISSSHQSNKRNEFEQYSNSSKAEALALLHPSADGPFFHVFNSYRQMWLDK